MRQLPPDIHEHEINGFAESMQAPRCAASRHKLIAASETPTAINAKTAAQKRKPARLLAPV